MKKVKLLIVALCVVAMAATGALASTLTVAVPDGGTKTDYRLTTSGAYLIGPTGGNVADKSVLYTLTTTLSTASSFTFKLTNAKFVAGTFYYLMKLDQVTGLLSQSGVTLLQVAADTDTITINVSDDLLNGDKLYLTKASHAGVVYSEADMIDVKLNQGLSASSTATIAVSAATNSVGQSVPDALTTAVTLYSLGDGLALTKAGDATKTINVNDNRETFVGDTVAERTTSDTTLELTTSNNSVVNQVDPGAADTWSLTLKGSLQGVKSLAIGGAAAVDITDAERAAGVVTRAGTFAAPDWTDAAQDVVLNLFPEGEREPLETRSFTYTFDDNGTPVVSDAAFVTWGINGAQFYVPNVKNGVWSNLLITNTASISGTITVDITTADGTFMMVDLGTIAANTVKPIGATEFNAAVGDDFDSKQASALFTITIPADKCFVSVVSGKGNNRFGVPVYTPPDATSWK